jgi:hypothetical protein
MRNRVHSVLRQALPALVLAAISCSPARDRRAPESRSAERAEPGATDTGRPRTVMTARGAWPPPGFPIVEGDQLLTETWRIHLPAKFTRRQEEESLVFWRPGLTIWLTAWNNDRDESQAQRLRRIKEIASPRRFAEHESTDGTLTRFSYRLRDESDDGPVEAVYGYVLGDNGDLQLSVYFDDPADETMARRIVDSVTATAQ